MSFRPAQSNSETQRSSASAHQVSELLKHAGLRPTRQRLALGELLFGTEDRHVTAEMLHEEVVSTQFSVSLATVYNTLRQFTEAGLLRAIAVDGARTYFDTNTSAHHHFLNERTGRLIDIPSDEMRIAGLPDAPEGMEIASVDVIVRVRDRRKV
ncbi:MAG: iron response transcriptional regulator IrrA [Pseudomonadota bacterium]